MTASANYSSLTNKELIALRAYLSGEEDALDNLSDNELMRIRLVLSPPENLGVAGSIGAGALEGYAGMLGLAEMASMALPTVQQAENITLGRDIEAQALYDQETTQSDLIASLLGEDDILPMLPIRAKASVQQAATPGSENLVSQLFQSLPASEGLMANVARGASRATIGVAAGGGVGLPVSPAILGGAAIGGGAAGVGEAAGFNPLVSAAMELGTGVGATAFLENLGRAGPVTLSPLAREGKSFLEASAAKAIVQQGESGLNREIEKIASSQLRDMELATGRLSESRFAELAPLRTTLSEEQQQLQQLARNGILDTVHPTEATNQTAMTRIQNAVNQKFQESVIEAEAAAYSAAKAKSATARFSTPNTLQQAKNLRADMMRVAPSPEQEAVINELNRFIGAIEEGRGPQILGPDGMAFGEGLAPAQMANEHIQNLQNANRFVSYDSALRSQSDRMKPILATYRREIAGKLPEDAREAWNAANSLHARNAEIWGTRYMRGLRFEEVPERILSQTKTPSNLQNLKKAMGRSRFVSLMERQIIDDITAKGSAESQRLALKQLAPRLTPTARRAAKELVDLGDKVGSQGARAAEKKALLSDIVQAAETGQPPTKALGLYETAKGRRFVHESLGKTEQGRQVAKSLDRMYTESLVNEFTKADGTLNIAKVKDIFNSPNGKEIKAVLRDIGGQDLVNRFEGLARIAENIEKNVAIYTKPSFREGLRTLLQTGQNHLLISGMLHLFHFPTAFLLSAGIVRAGAASLRKVSSLAINTALRNPKIYRALEQMSRSQSAELSLRLLPQIIGSIENEITASGVSLEELGGE